MMKNIRRTVIPALLITGVLGFAASGCANTVEPAAHRDIAVGTCHNLRFEPEVTAVSDGRPSVPCSRAHTSQTFAIATVTGTYAAWSARPGQQILNRLSAQLCDATTARSFLRARDRDGVIGFSIRGYFPTTAAWSRGDRRVTCDMQFTTSNGAPRQVTASLAGIMRTTSSAGVRACYRQKADPAGGWKPTGATVPCSTRHSSQDIDAWVGINSATPTAAAIATRCAPFTTNFPGTRVTGVVRSQSNGSFSLHCAIGGDSNDGLVTGAILPRA